MKKSYKGFPIYALIIIGVLIAAQLFSSSFSSQRGQRIEAAKLFEYIDSGVIDAVALEDDVAYAHMKASNIPLSAFSNSAYDFSAIISRDTFVETCRQLAARKAGTTADDVTEIDLGFDLSYLPQPTTPWLLEMLPYIIMTVGLMAFWMMMMRQQGGGGGKMMTFGHSPARVFEPDGNRVTFADVAGAVEEKEEMQELVEFLKNPRRFTAVGARIPKGVLLVGPPGTGKTLLAKAVAGEAGVPFMSISGSDFVEMFVGVGASRVRDLFDQAKKHAPCIVFIDEIDAVGRRRGAGMGGGHDEREQTLNQLLTEMDGFDAGKGVVILAATNRPEILDKALLRPGRFDRRIPVELPDLAGREAILRVHAKDVKTEPNIDYTQIARATSGCSGAELANIINEAAIAAVKDNRKAVSQRDLEEAIETVIAGYQRKNAVVSPRDKLTVSYHECGHALVAAKLKNAAPVQKITIIPRTSGALGYTMQVDEEERLLMTREQILDKITTFCGGRAAEQLIFGRITSGASNDIEQATKLARAMITRLGMSDTFGMMALETQSGQYLSGDSNLVCSDQTAARIDVEVKQIIANCYEQAYQILSDNKEKLHETAKVLLEKETITGMEFMAILAPNQLPSAEGEKAEEKPEEKTDDSADDVEVK